MRQWQPLYIAPPVVVSLLVVIACRRGLHPFVYNCCDYIVHILNWRRSVFACGNFFARHPSTQTREGSIKSVSIDKLMYRNEKTDRQQHTFARLKSSSIGSQPFRNKTIHTQVRDGTLVTLKGTTENNETESSRLKFYYTPSLILIGWPADSRPWYGSLFTVKPTATSTTKTTTAVCIYTLTHTLHYTTTDSTP